MAEWRDQAECRAWPAEWWIHDHGDDNPRTATCRECAWARAICQGCPVRDDCLTYALEAGEPAGMWGGLSPVERLDLAPARTEAEREVVHGTLTAYRWHCRPRCDQCKAAHARHRQEYREKNRGRRWTGAEAWHGTIEGHSGRLCTCDECKAAKARADAVTRRNRRKATA